MNKKLDLLVYNCEIVIQKKKNILITSIFEYEYLFLYSNIRLLFELFEYQH